VLLRFSVGNHLSFRDEQEISLVASSLKDIEMGLLAYPGIKDRGVLPAAVIYGANASGKSNFIDALEYMQWQILESHKRGEPRGRIFRAPFALDPKYAKTSSIFDIDFISKGIHYHYGFEVTDQIFDSEWLYAFPHGARQVLFERKRSRFKFGRNLKGRNKIISELTRPNSLFLSAAIQNDHKQITTISEFFQSMRVDSRISIPGGLASTHLADEDVDDRVIKFLSQIGTGVIAYRKSERPVPEELITIQNAIRSAVRRMKKGNVTIEPGFGVEKESLIELAHKGIDGRQIFMDLDRESAGTRRLLILLWHAYRTLDQGGLLLIDELDASLHTQACEAVLALFSQPELNPKGAQMIATTHDTNLLRSALLRRDQVWFTEKDAMGATHLYPLTDIRTRKGDNIERGYLQGRFGAIPFAGPVSDILMAG
jgi:uncharacterized protein